MSAILAVIQFPLLAICKSSEVPSIFKLIANSLFSIVAGFGTVYSFRGIWYLLDAYYITGKNFDIERGRQKTGKTLQVGTIMVDNQASVEGIMGLIQPKGPR